MGWTDFPSDFTVANNCRVVLSAVSYWEHKYGPVSLNEEGHYTRVIRNWNSLPQEAIVYCQRAKFERRHHWTERIQLGVLRSLWPYSLGIKEMNAVTSLHSARKHICSLGDPCVEPLILLKVPLYIREGVVYQSDNQRSLSNIILTTGSTLVYEDPKNKNEKITTVDECSLWTCAEKNQIVEATEKTLNVSEDDLEFIDTLTYKFHITVRNFTELLQQNHPFYIHVGLFKCHQWSICKTSIKISH